MHVQGVGCGAGQVRAGDRGDAPWLSAVDKMMHYACMCRVWDVARGKCEQVMEGHTGRLNSVRLGPGGTALTVSDDYTARVWDLSTGMCKHVFKGALLAS